jgi:hypothetical protein
MGNKVREIVVIPRPGADYVTPGKNIKSWAAYLKPCDNQNYNITSSALELNERKNVAIAFTKPPIYFKQKQFALRDVIHTSLFWFKLCVSVVAVRSYIRALSAHSAAEFNILPDRWQHVWLLAIVPPQRWGEMDRNECHTAWGNFKTLISSLHD